MKNKISYSDGPMGEVKVVLLKVKCVKCCLTVFQKIFEREKLYIRIPGAKAIGVFSVDNPLSQSQGH